MQARWYDPSTGQFISRDPDVQQTLQPYAYAGDNPVANSDVKGYAPGDQRTGACEICLINAAIYDDNFTARLAYAYNYLTMSLPHLSPRDASAVIGNLRGEDPCLHQL